MLGNKLKFGVRTLPEMVALSCNYVAYFRRLNLYAFLYYASKISC